jgi:hypothetical protein
MTDSRVLGVASTNFPSTTLWKDSEQESIQEGDSSVFVMLSLSYLNIIYIHQGTSTRLVY